MTRFAAYKYLPFLLVLCFFLLSTNCSHFFKKKKPEVREKYSFFVAGHSAGTPYTNSQGLYYLFKEKIDFLNSSANLEFGFFTGDIVHSPTAESWGKIDQDKLDLNKPVYFIVGENEAQDRQLFVSRYGETYRSFIFNGDLFIILDTELDSCSITGDQLDFLKHVLIQNSAARRIFVFLHKLIWIGENNRYSILKDKTNSLKGYDFNANFWKDVEPLFNGLNNDVYIFAGDVGVAWSIPAFYDHYDNIHFIASGMGGNNEENFVMVTVDESSVKFDMIGLGNEFFEKSSIEDYNLEYYSNQYIQPYSFFVAGHVYGKPGVDNEGLHPPFEKKFGLLNDSDSLRFGVFTGDIVIASTGENWDAVDSKLELLDDPVYFSLGNHDYGNMPLYTSRYGNSYRSFNQNGDLFLILDTEMDSCDIIGDQLDFLKRELSRNKDVDNIFVFFHRLIWISENNKYSPLMNRVNNVNGYNFNSNFWTEIESIFKELKAQVYFFAGDVGIKRSIPAFYDNYDNIHFIASGMGGNEEENFLIVTVRGNFVHFDMVNLDEKPFSLNSLKDYNLGYISTLKKIFGTGSVVD